MTPAPPSDFEALKRLSAAIGADDSLVQAAGGNTSLKTDDTLWIKASGVWLSQVMTREGFVAVDRARLLADLAHAPERTEDPSAYAHGEALRPSIETTLHALMPHRVVLHVHSVDAIARLCVEEAGEALGLLEGRKDVRTALVPYARPGLPLTKAVQAALQETGDSTNTLLLRNHGLVVGADTVEEAQDRLARVVRTLALSPRPAAARDTARDNAWRAAGFVAAPGRTQTLATDPAAIAVATAGSLYPDHVVFLGRGLCVFDGPHGVPDETRIALDPGHGVYLRADLGPAGDAMALCLADVAARAVGTPRPITQADEDALLGWDAEKHRIALEMAPA